MTRLLIDMGNSRLKWSLQQADHLAISPQHSLSYPAAPEAFPLALQHIWEKVSPPVEVWFASVTTSARVTALTQWLTQQWQVTPLQVTTTQHACGVHNAYVNPTQLGVDRWLAMIAAHHLIHSDVCVVDCGTAVTLDVVTATGHHQGGLIVPGISTMRQALATDTHALAALMQLHLQQDQPTVLARDTRMGIEVGTVYAVVGFIETVMTRLAQRGKMATLILTGGEAEALMPFLQHPCEHIPNLVLQGLGILAKNQNR